MNINHEEYIDMISENGTISAMRYQFDQQMTRVWTIIVSGGALIAAIIILGILRDWIVSDIALMVGAISAATTALAGTLAGIATAGKVGQAKAEFTPQGIPKP